MTQVLIHPNVPILPRAVPAVARDIRRADGERFEVIGQVDEAVGRPRLRGLNHARGGCGFFTGSSSGGLFLMFAW